MNNQNSEFSKKINLVPNEMKRNETNVTGNKISKINTTYIYKSTIKT